MLYLTNEPVFIFLLSRSSPLVEEFTSRFPKMSLLNVLSEFSLPTPLSEHNNPLGLPQHQVHTPVNSTKTVLTGTLIFDSGEENVAIRERSKASGKYPIGVILVPPLIPSSSPLFTPTLHLLHGCSILGSICPDSREHRKSSLDLSSRLDFRSSYSASFKISFPQLSLVRCLSLMSSHRV